jgi:polyribonucleotide nucleotidyltransferase
MQMFDGAQVFSTEVGGRTLSIETGVLAAQAGGAVTVRYGDTVLMAVATMSHDVRPGMNFFPMTIEFEERLYAAGRIPGSFFRREGRPSEQAILLARLVDRPLRPLFPKGMRNEVQIIIYTLSSDGENLMDPLAIIAASAALTISDIPWNGPIASSAIGFVDGEYVVNPTAEQMELSSLNLVVAGTDDNILMVEAGANELPEDMMLEALKLAHESMQPVIEIIKEMREQLGKPKVEDFPVFLPADEVIEEVRALATDKLAVVIADGPSRKELKEGRNAVRAEVEKIFAERLEEGVVSAKDIGDSMDSVFKEVTRARILADGIRPDGRETTEIRNISAQVGRLPRTHGSGLFMRGETHVLTLTTLGTPGDAQRLDTLQPISTKKYMHHYNFPPYSTGEAYPLRGTKRREVGHGALAERALKPVIPENFPYTLRLVSEAVSSNGSTSMGSVCGSTLSLMDAGVPITAPVSGIAMGLIQDPESGAYRILSDIQGLEDALGDMDFKIAGTEHGVTALQMDLKIKGLDFSILGEALEQAREGRMYIMSKMLEVLPSPREEMSEFAPRILTVNIDPEKIGMLIGPGGKTIRGLQENFEVKIDVEEDGTVFVSGAGVGAEHARDEVERLTETIEVGKIYTGTVVRVEAYGAFVNIKPGLDGMVHISQLADYRVDKVEDIAKLGDELTAMVIDVDPGGKVRMSRQAVLEGWTAEEARKRDSGGRSSGGGGRGGDRRGGGGRDRRR